MSNTEATKVYAVTISINPFNVNVHTHGGVDDEFIPTLSPLRSAQQLYEERLRDAVNESAQSGFLHGPSFIQRSIYKREARKAADRAARQREKFIDAVREWRRNLREKELWEIGETAKDLVDGITNIHIEVVKKGSKWYATAYEGDEVDDENELGTSRGAIVIGEDCQSVVSSLRVLKYVLRMWNKSKSKSKPDTEHCGSDPDTVPIILVWPDASLWDRRNSS